MKKRRQNRETAIPKPIPEAIPQTMISSNINCRSQQKREEKEWESALKRAQQFKEFAQVIRLPYSLSDYDKPMSQDEKKAMEDCCEGKLGENQSPQCFSAQFVDLDGQPILCYFGRRVKRIKPPVCS